jgi:hypothetical protein
MYRNKVVGEPDDVPSQAYSQSDDLGTGCPLSDSITDEDPTAICVWRIFLGKFAKDGA